MATNAEENGDDNADQTAEDVLRSAKYPKDDVETSEEADETSDGDDADKDADEVSEDDGQTDDDAGDDESEEDDKTDSDEDESYVKEFPNIKGDTLEDYSRNLEAAYKNSTSEALRLKGELDKLKTKDAAIGKTDDDSDDSAPVDTDDPLKMWAQQSLNKEIDDAYNDFAKLYPQVTDPADYDKFRREVETLSRTIMSSQKRLATPRELYSKAAVILGWESESTPSSKDKLKVALKNGAAISRTSSSTKKTPKSKVTDNQIAIYRKMNPSDDKSDLDIRKELEVYA